MKMQPWKACAPTGCHENCASPAPCPQRAQLILGTWVAPVDGVYTFKARHDDGMRLYIDGEVPGQQPGAGCTGSAFCSDTWDGQVQRITTAYYKAGLHCIRAEWWQGVTGGWWDMSIAPPGGPDSKMYLGPPADRIGDLPACPPKGLL